MSPNVESHKEKSLITWGIVKITQVAASCEFAGSHSNVAVD
jgi:hypothetical protein